jgi:hypothetical protein
MFFASGNLQSEINSKNTFLKPQRIEYIKKGINAFTQSKSDNLANTYSYLRALKNTKCSSSVKQLELQCLIESSQKNCQSYKGQQLTYCHLYSDHMLALLIEEDKIVTRSLKAKILKKTQQSLSVAVLNEMEKHYAVIITDLLASKYWNCKGKNSKSCLSKSIHDFCYNYSDTRNGSWQGCVSGLIFYIGSKRRK